MRSRPMLALLLAAAAGACAGGQARRASNLLPCDFVALEQGDVDHVAACAVRAPEGAITVRREALGRARFGPEGLTEARIDGRWFFVTRHGRTAAAYWFDNGTDPFVEGLARTVRDGKVGFVDAGLTEVIPPRWDFASPFDGGLAMVCEGCASRPAGEHYEVVGGRWGYIDRSGRVVVPVVHDRDALPGRETIGRR